MGRIIFWVISLGVVLTSCSFDITKDDVDKVKDIFSAQLDNLYYLYENNIKDIVEDFSLEKAEIMLNDILSNIPDDKKELVYKGIEKGITLVEDGKEVLADKLSIDISFEGVEKAYAIQAGREVRVVLNNVKTDERTAAEIAKEIAKKIEAELRYPGKIKVTAIRETRFIEYAR
jgi:HD superfamily phosphodiesterase